jgi:hypothetical protein
MSILLQVAHRWAKRMASPEGLPTDLNSGRVQGSSTRFTMSPMRRPVERFDLTCFVQMKYAVELARDGRAEIMARQFCLRSIDDADRTFQQRLAQRLAAGLLQWQEESIKPACVKHVFVAVRVRRSHPAAFDRSLHGKLNRQVCECIVAEVPHELTTKNLAEIRGYLSARLQSWLVRVPAPSMWTRD